MLYVRIVIENWNGIKNNASEAQMAEQQPSKLTVRSSILLRCFMKLWYFDLPFACGGVIEENGIIVKTPPILYKFRGQSLENLKSWIESKNGMIKKESSGGAL